MEIVNLGFFMFDPVYFIFMAPAMLLALYAQLKVKSAYARMSRVPSARGLSGAEAAVRILHSAGIQDVKVEQTQGWLSDHYDPKSKVLRLSPEVYQGRSLASVGIAAHEAGHALQHAVNYGPLTLRSAIVPVAGIGSWLAWPMIMIGFFMGAMNLVTLGILLFSVLVIFQIITLPVEFNASSRAKVVLASTGIVADQKELQGVASVLNAAALTYVAATITAIAQLLYFLLRSGLLGGSRS
jgi:Zn-dependent membrane protease YugP